MDDKLFIDSNNFKKLTIHEKLDVLYNNTCNLKKVVKTEARGTAIVTTVIILLPIIITFIGMMV